MLLLSASLVLALQQTELPPASAALAQAKVCSVLSDAFIPALEAAVASPNATDANRASLQAVLDTKRQAETEFRRLVALATPDQLILGDTEFSRVVERLNQSDLRAKQDHLQDCVLSLSGW